MDKQTRQTLRDLHCIYHTLQTCEDKLAQIPRQFKHVYISVPGQLTDALRLARAGVSEIALQLVQFQNLPLLYADLSRKNSTIKK